MSLLYSVFGFYLREKISALKEIVTWGYLLSGFFLVAGLLAPSFSFSFYLAFIFLSWALLRGKVSRAGMFYFWLPYGVAVGFGIWQYVFPLVLGPILGILFSFLLGNLFYLLQTKISIAQGKFFLLPAGFFLFEYLFHSVPGLNAVELPLLLGIISTHTPLLRLVLLTGSALGLLCILLMINGLTVYILERNWKSYSLAIPALILALVVVANLLSGTSSGDKVTIAAVQGATAMDTSELQGQDYLDYVYSTYAMLIEDIQADIILFPEVSMAIYFPEQQEYDGSRLVDLARDKDALLIPLVTEYRRGQAGREERYITALVVSPEGVIGKASKRNLVPFSEARTVTPGTDYKSIPTEFGELGIAICYDFNDPGTISRLKANGAEVILAPFNDSGFGRLFHRIHAHYPVLSSLEQNIPIVVANEDGISQIVDRNGKVLDRIDIGRQGVVMASFDLSPTPGFSWFSRYLEFFLALGIIAMFFVKAFTKKKAAAA